MYKSLEDLPLVMKVSDIQNVLGCGRKQAYELCQGDIFPVARVGKSIRVSRDAFVDWLHGK